jgi:hypothetical protein
MMIQKILLTVSLMFLFVVCVELLSSMPPEPNPEDLYCEMTQLYKDTGGEFGWPDYNSKHINCEGSISVK